MDFQPVTDLCLFVFMAVSLNDSILSDNDLLSVLNIYTRLGRLCIQVDTVDGIPFIRCIRHCDCINARRIYYVYGKIFCDVEAVPLIIYCDNLSLDNVTQFVAITIESFSIKSPFEVHRILREDEFLVVVNKRNPLTIDIYLSTRDLVNYTVIVSLLKWSSFIRFKVCR